MPDDERIDRKPREVTGRTVLFCLLAFFGVVIGVNAVMVRAATSTFGGLETENAYKTGLAFNRDIAAAHAQDALHWKVDGKIARDAQGEAGLEIEIRDGGGALLRNLAVSARLAHPTDARLDRPLALAETKAGIFRGQADAAPGQWHLVLDIYRGEERLFRSTTRVMLR